MSFTRHPVILKVLETTLGEPAVHFSIGTLFDKVANSDHQIGWYQDTFFVLELPENREFNLEGHRY
ncbi:TPA: hypothetical protein EYN98_24040 [Candidatus Poribacteria bacterium]|nr:hypothetical protein [Candidatus Poribacteria bacterium]HIA69052.1 hypothetical protein [Candidatus Poribacteria bacterium]HIB92516.1 hypothetical protein [Candidatus Poribacteria bacterium]HIC00369.1 hypothetical protein [Candidatus Poribacteria bacterium]HIC18874.1 hypothetical protein [Candidatus Poribacteria bacterium]